MQGLELGLLALSHMEEVVDTAAEVAVAKATAVGVVEVEVESLKPTLLTKMLIQQMVPKLSTQVLPVTPGDLPNPRDQHST